MTDPRPAPTPSHAEPHDRGYVAVPLITVMDPRMSPKALGLLTYALARQSMPGVEWRLYVSEIASNFCTGVEAVETGLKELEQLGYARYVRNPRSRGRFTGGRYVVTATSDSAPAWPRHSGPGARVTTTAPGKAARGRTARGPSPAIQNDVPARPARGAGVQLENHDVGAAQEAWKPACSPEAGCSAQDAGGNAAGHVEHPQAGEWSAALRGELDAVLVRSRMTATSDAGQALIAAVEAALGQRGVGFAQRAVRAALGDGIRHPAAYLRHVLGRAATEVSPSASPTTPPDVDVDAWRARVLDKQLRVNGQLTARVQDVLTGRWPARLLADGRELRLEDLGDVEVVG